MLRYVVQRLLLLIPLLFAISLVTFAALQLAPGDPITAQFGLDVAKFDQETLTRMRQELGLYDPLPVQYLHYMGNLLRGDMGRSIASKTPVAKEIFGRLPATLELAAASMFIVALISLPLGIVSALKRGSWLDNLCMGGALLGVSMPSFWFGIMLILLFSVTLHWLPTGGRGHGLVGSLRSLALPALTLAMGAMGLMTRIVRSSMLEVLGQDYLRTAHAKGLRPATVVTRHALRNALIPVVTLFGMQMAGLLGGAVIIETIFAWPGIGRLAVNAIWRRDYPVVMGTVLVFALTFALANLLVDVLYTVIDPRIRYDR